MPDFDAICAPPLLMRAERGCRMPRQRGSAKMCAAPCAACARARADATAEKMRASFYAPPPRELFMLAMSRSDIYAICAKRPRDVMHIIVTDVITSFSFMLLLC